MAEKKDDDTGKAEVDPKVSETGLPEEETQEAALTPPEHNPMDEAAATADDPVTADGEETPEDTSTATEPELTAPVHDPREEAEAVTGVDEAVLMAGAASTAEAADAGDDKPYTAPDVSEDMPAAAATDPEEARAPTHPATPPASPPKEVVVQKKGGFGAALLGGVAAAAIGFGLAIWLYPDGTPFSKKEDVSAALQQQLDAQKSEIDALKADLAEANATPALDALKTQVTQVTDSVKQALDTLDRNTADLSNLRSRLEEVSASGIADNVSAQAQQAYETALSKLQDTMANQRAEIEGMIDQSQQMKADAAATARDTTIRANLTQIATALDSGDPFSSQIEALMALGLQIPEALQQAATTGVATMAQLRADFPDYARDVLNATRDSGDTSSFTSFLKNQLGARSLTPQEGDDPDAVLSRAEDDLRKGQLQAALDELQALPEAAQVEIEPWLTQAVARAKAVAGLQDMQSANQSN